MSRMATSTAVDLLAGDCLFSHIVTVYSSVSSMLAGSSVGFCIRKKMLILLVLFILAPGIQFSA
jgi:hypothetical protein